MKKPIVFLVSILLALGPASLDNRSQAAGIFSGQCRGVRVVRRQVVVANASQKVITPFAVALGVPVASNHGVTYSYNAASQQPANLQPQIKQAVREALLEILQNANGSFNALAEPSPSLVQQNCAACHAGEAAQNGFRVDVPMSDADRLAAARQVLTGAMPKGKSLDEQSVGNLLGELIEVNGESERGAGN